MVILKVREGVYCFQCEVLGVTLRCRAKKTTG